MNSWNSISDFRNVEIPTISLGHNDIEWPKESKRQLPVNRSQMPSKRRQFRLGQNWPAVELPGSLRWEPSRYSGAPKPSWRSMSNRKPWTHWNRYEPLEMELRCATMEPWNDVEWPSLAQWNWKLETGVKPTWPQASIATHLRTSVKSWPNSRDRLGILGQKHPKAFKDHLSVARTRFRISEFNEALASGLHPWTESGRSGCPAMDFFFFSSLLSSPVPNCSVSDPVLMPTKATIGVHQQHVLGTWLWCSKLQSA